MHCLLISKHDVYYGIQKVQFWSHLSRLYFPSISQTCLNVVQQIQETQFNMLFLQQKSAWIKTVAVKSVAYRFFETILHLFCCSPQMVLESWTTRLIISFTPLSEILKGTPGSGCFMVKLYSFHFGIMAPTVLLGTFSSLEILL